MSVDEFRVQMNQMAAESKPFVFIIDFELQKPIICPLSEAEHRGITLSINQPSELQQKSTVGIVNTNPISAEEYDRGFQYVQEQIHLGNSYLTNLTYPTAVSLDTSLKNLYQRAQARYKLLYQDQFLIFSPECFVTIEQDYIYSYPMKGTIDADLPDARQQLLEDKKERYEHNTIVDLLRNDLAMVGSHVEVTRFRYLELIQTHQKNLLQMSSEIRARLPNDWRTRLGDIIITLLPAGSVSGAPKAKTCEIIRTSELGPRGYYSGIFGVFDGEKLDSAVNIRYLEKQGDKFFYRSGGGITALSDQQSEYDEMVAKVYVPTA